MNLLKKNYEIIIICDTNNFLFKKYFSKHIKKDYNSMAFTAMINHDYVKNNTAEQYFTGVGPLAVVNRDVCTLTMPACSLLGIPYAHSFDEDPCLEVNDGDEVEMKLEDAPTTFNPLELVDQHWSTVDEIYNPTLSSDWQTYQYRSRGGTRQNGGGVTIFAVGGTSGSATSSISIDDISIKPIHLMVGGKKKEKKEKRKRNKTLESLFKPKVSVYQSYF